MDEWLGVRACTHSPDESRPIVPTIAFSTSHNLGVYPPSRPATTPDAVARAPTPDADADLARRPRASPRVDSIERVARCLVYT